MTLPTALRRVSTPWGLAAVSATALAVVLLAAAVMWTRDDTAAPPPTLPTDSAVDAPSSEKYAFPAGAGDCDVVDATDLERFGNGLASLKRSQLHLPGRYCSGQFGAVRFSVSVLLTGPGHDRRHNFDVGRYLAGSHSMESWETFTLLPGLGEAAFLTVADERPHGKEIYAYLRVLDENLFVEVTTQTTEPANRADLEQSCEHQARTVMQRLRVS